MIDNVEGVWIYGELEPSWGSETVSVADRLVCYQGGRLFAFLNVHSTLVDIDLRQCPIIVEHGGECYHVNYIRDMFEHEIVHVKDIEKNAPIWSYNGIGYEKFSRTLDISRPYWYPVKNPYGCEQYYKNLPPSGITQHLYVNE